MLLSGAPRSGLPTTFTIGTAGRDQSIDTVELTIVSDVLPGDADCDGDVDGVDLMVSATYPTVLAEEFEPMLEALVDSIEFE